MTPDTVFLAYNAIGVRDGEDMLNLFRKNPLVVCLRNPLGGSEIRSVLVKMTDMQEQVVEEMTKKVVELLETNKKKGVGWMMNKLVTKWAKVVESYFNGDNADALQVILHF